MNDNTPQNSNSDQNPDPNRNPDLSETTRLPETAGRAATDPASGSAPAPASTPAPAPASSRRGLRPLWIGLGAAAAVLLVGGAGAAIALAIDDDRDDRAFETREHDDHGDRPGTGDDRSGAGDDRSGSDDRSGADDGRAVSSGAGASAAQAFAPSDAASLADAIDAAIAEADGAGATSIEVERGGWDVDVVLEDRREVDVFVPVDGAVTVRETGSDGDRESDPVLDTARLSGIVDAAIEAAGGGSIESISSDDGRVRYDVSVVLDGGRDVEVELGEDLVVIAVDED